MSGDFYSIIEHEPIEIPVATVIVPRTKHKKSKDDASHSGDDFSCPYDLKYCVETINAYQKFEERVRNAFETGSEELIFQQDGFSVDYPPCDDVMRANCARYKMWCNANKKTR